MSRHEEGSGLSFVSFLLPLFIIYMYTDMICKCIYKYMYLRICLFIYLCVCVDVLLVYLHISTEVCLEGFRNTLAPCVWTYGWKLESTPRRNRKSSALPLALNSDLSHVVLSFVLGPAPPKHQGVRGGLRPKLRSMGFKVIPTNIVILECKAAQASNGFPVVIKSCSRTNYSKRALQQLS